MKQTNRFFSAVLTIVTVVLLGTGCASIVYTPYDTTGAAHYLPVALVSMETDLSPDRNRATMKRYVDAIVSERPGVRLIAFGETSLGWYSKIFGPAEYQRTVAENIDGPTVTTMRERAANYGVYISFGFAELDGDKVYDSAVVIDPEGNLAAHRRKSNFVVFDDANGFTPGPETLTITYIDGIKTAFLICNDFNDTDYQKAVRDDNHIKIVLLPQASAGLRPDFVKTQPQPFIGTWMLAPQRYAVEELSNYYGSWLIDPNGYMPASSGSPGYLYYELGIK